MSDGDELQRVGFGEHALGGDTSWLTGDRLRLLLDVARLGSLGAAARVAGISQPQASRSVAALERHLGLRLLRRGPRGSVLSQGGAALLPYAGRAIAALDALRTEASALTCAAPRELAFAASRTIGDALVPLWLRAYAARDPQREVTCSIANSREVAARVRAGGVPFGFVEDPVDHPGLHAELLGADRLCVVVAPEHPWAARASAESEARQGGTAQTPGPAEGPPHRRPATVSAAELASTPLVERERGSGTRATLDAALPARARPAAVMDSTSAIVRAVRAGHAPAVLSALAVQAELEAGELVGVEVDGLALERPLRVLWRGDAPPSGAAAAFVDVVRAWASAPT